MLLKSDRSQIQIGVLVGVILISLGFVFRVVHLDQKVFWVDEVATALRAAGYTKQEVTDLLADGALHTPADLLSYQRLTPNRTLADALTAFQHSPEHAPLYFLLTRFWMQLFGSSVAAIRSFSVVCSLLLLPAVYGLCQVLLGKPAVSRMAVGLMAISPFFIAYAQEARPYSLWVLTLALSSTALLRALKTNHTNSWLLYALALGLSFYTSLLSLGVAVGQAIYMLVIERLRFSQRLCRFGLAWMAAFIALVPWLWSASQSWQTVQANTTWMRLPLDGLVKAVIWFYSVAILYFDVPVILEPWPVAAAELGIAAGVVAVIAVAFYQLWQHTPARIGLFVLSLSLPVPVALILLDLIREGRYSTAPRYLLPFHLGAQLAVAYFLVHQGVHQEVERSADRQPAISRGELRPGQALAAFLIAMSLFSNCVHLNTSPRYLKSRSLHNLPITTIINQVRQPLLITETENTIDLLSLSHSLNPDVLLKILPTAALGEQLNQEAADAFDSFSTPAPTPSVRFSHRDDQALAIHWASQPSCRVIFLFNPSPALQQQLQHNPHLRLTQRYQPQVLLPGEIALSLWQLTLEEC